MMTVVGAKRLQARFDQQADGRAERIIDSDDMRKSGDDKFEIEEMLDPDGPELGETARTLAVIDAQDQLEWLRREESRLDRTLEKTIALLEGAQKIRRSRLEGTPPRMAIGGLSTVTHPVASLPRSHTRAFTPARPGDAPATRVVRTRPS